MSSCQKKLKKANKTPILNVPSKINKARITTTN